MKSTALHRALRELANLTSATAAALALTAVLLFAVSGQPALAGPKVFTGIVKGVAVGGYDPVAFFTRKRAVRGSKDFEITHQGVKWRFATAANRDAFLAEPAKYEPQFGGYCAWAVSRNYTAKGDPVAWTVHKGKLYLNYNKSVRASWLKAVDRNIKRGEQNWPGLSG